MTIFFILVLLLCVLLVVETPTRLDDFRETPLEWLRGWTEYQLRKRNVYVHWLYWNWGTQVRFNSSMTWGASPYKEYNLGPFSYRRYL